MVFPDLLQTIGSAISALVLVISFLGFLLRRFSERSEKRVYKFITSPVECHKEKDRAILHITNYSGISLKKESLHKLDDDETHPRLLEI